jgi:hypothetical protein
MMAGDDEMIAKDAMLAEELMAQPRTSPRSSERRRMLEGPPASPNMEEARSMFQKTVCCIWFLVATFALIPIIVALVWMKKHQGCGIPVYWWIIIYFLIALIAITGLLFVPCCFTRERSSCILPALISLFLIQLWGQAIWSIYGHSLYFSDDNDCGDKSDTRGWMIFMIILLFLGLFQIMSALIFTCVICCNLSTIIDQMKNRPADSEQREGLVGTLQGVIFNPEQFKDK